jgi:hypothetical protein
LENVMLGRAALSSVALISAIGVFVTEAKADNFSVNPAGTFYRTNSDPAPNPTIIDLSTLSFTVHDGDTLHLARLGNWAGGPASEGWPDTATSLAGLFSSTNTILASSNLNRVPGALAAGVGYVSSPTFFGSLPTDIPQDFLIDNDPAGTGMSPGFSSINITVPAGAHYLFLNTFDSHYSTNSDANGNFGIAITAVPEPAGLSLLGLGCIALLRRKRRGA